MVLAAFAARKHQIPFVCKRGTENGRFWEKRCRVCNQNAQNGDFVQTRQRQICLF